MTTSTIQTRSEDAKQKSFDDVADEAARLDHESARCELRLLAAICPIGRRGLALAAQAGVETGDFGQPDTTVIYKSLLLANQENIIGDRTTAARLVRVGLEMA